MNKNKIIFWMVFLLLLSLVPITILSTTSLAAAIKFPATIMNLIQRILGLTIFVLLFWQILLGSFMTKLTEKFGGWIYNFHVTEGIIIYTLVLLHPTFFVLFNYFAGRGLDPFYVFTQVCLLCENRQELYYTLGRISFWLINITVFVGLFRTTTPFLRRHWKKFHDLNFIVFLLIGIHGLSIGTDFMQMPFFAFAIVAYLIVLYIFFVRKLPKYFK
jgi:predicted ferric reductase